MKNLETLTPDQAPALSQEIFGAIKKNIGMLPNLYATIGNSGHALKATLAIGETLASGEFTDKEREVIALAVAQANDCDYCLAAHTAIGQSLGFTLEDTVAIRSGEAADDKLRTLATLSASITETRGFPGQEKIDAFFDAGYSQAALAELIVLVGLNTITNYTNHIAGTTVDFPAAPELATA